MSEFLGTPDIQVILRKKSFQFVAPPTDLDLSVSDFYTEYSTNGLETDNIFFIPEMGAAMVQPLFTNRSNYIDSAVTPIYYYDDVTVEENGVSIDKYKYVVEVPEGAPPETQQEVERRVFELGMTFTQFWQWKSGLYAKADWKDLEDSWDSATEGHEYSGPEFKTIAREPSGRGAKQLTTWIDQTSSAPNVEWFLLQKGYNYTNQPFWVHVFKNKKVETDAEDPIRFNRYYRYGKLVESFFAVRLGWNDPYYGKWGDNKRSRNKGGHGPFDVVFPIDGSPFIWDHGTTSEKTEEPEEERDIDGNEAHPGETIRYEGYMAGENNSSDSWVLRDDMDEFTLLFMVIRGKLVIKSSFSPNPWIFPVNFNKVSKHTQDKYENFYIPAGRTVIMGRGFKFRMSFNPMEFDIYLPSGTKRENYSGKLVSRPIPERVEFIDRLTGDIRYGGLFDTYSYALGKPLKQMFTGKDEDDFQNFLVIPHANMDMKIDGSPETPSYGCDIVSTPYYGRGLGGASCSYTSMMIPIAGEDPYSESFNPDENNRDNTVVYTQMRTAGEEGDRTASTTSVEAKYGFRTSTTLNYANRIMEIGLFCRAPSKGGHNDETSDRFASPIVYRAKGKHFVPDTFPGEDIDISRLVLEIDYTTNASDFFTVRQNYKIKVIIPKESLIAADWPELYYPYNTRDGLIDLLCGGLREVEVKLGWMGGTEVDPAGHTKRTVFTGISNGVPTKETYALDTITLDCKDRIQLLEDYTIVNSPFYDGMILKEAFLHLATHYGLPRLLFGVRSQRANWEVLDLGYSFANPNLKWEDGTPLFDCLKTLAKRFWHVIRTDEYGRIILTDLNTTGNLDQQYAAQVAIVDDLPLSHPSYVFYVDGAQAPSAFERPYNSVDINRNFNDRATGMEIYMVNRQNNAIIMDNRTIDVEGIENPNSQDFLGYKKPMRLSEGAFGTVEKATYYRSLMESHIFQVPISVNFTTYGRPTIKPFDIIALQFPALGQEAYFGVNNPAGGNSSGLSQYLQLRVMSISGKIDLTSDMKYSLSISAEHR